MGVRDEDMRHGFAAHGIEERRNMPSIVGTGIDDGYTSMTEDITHGPLKRERSWIVGDEAPDAGGRLIHNTGFEIETPIEWNVFGHVALSWLIRHMDSPSRSSCVHNR
jgi:hypothetical protein